MYLAPLTYSNNNNRLIAGLVTSFFLLGAYMALQLTSLPEVRQKTDTYEEINWMRFQPKVEAPAPQPKPVETAKPVEPVKLDPLPEAPKPAPVTKVDLSALKSQLNTLAKPERSLKETSLNQKTETVGSSNTAKLDLKKSTVLGSMNTLLGESSRKLSLPNRGSSGRGSEGSGALSVGSGSSLEPSGSTDFSGGLSLGAPQTKEVNAGAAEISMVDMAQMGGEFEDLSPIYRALVEWMRQHPAQFPEVINRFMEKSPGDLVSQVTFQMGGRQFDMYLLCKEPLYEIRICLLQGGESTYLIDRGFKENSRFLRVGAVNRTGDGDILSFNTSRKAASDSRTDAFYQVFLSWWENVQQ